MVNGKWYIGQSEMLEYRKCGHFITLKQKRHSNKYIQFDYNKYGENNFEFFVLEYTPKDLLDKQEGFWISLQKAIYPFGYNRQRKF